jgi:hypothetical protein
LQQKSLNFHLGFVAQSSCLLLLLTRFAIVNVAWWGNIKTFIITLSLLHLQGEVHIPCTTKKQADDEISIQVVDQILAYNSLILILQQ